MDNQLSKFQKTLHSDSFSSSCIDNFTFLLGDDEHGVPVFKDLHSISNLIIAGATGTGKSTLAHCILLSLIEYTHSDRLRMILCDTKSIEFSVYQNLPHLLSPIASEPSHIQKLLDWSCDEAKRRLRQLNTSCCRSIDTYNSVGLQQGKTVLPHILFVLDDPVAAGFNTAGWNKLQWLAQNSKSTGIHLFLITQAPGDKHLSEIVKSSISDRAVFNIFSNAEEKLLLGTSKNTFLSNIGEIIYCTMPSREKQRIRCYPVNDADISTVFSKFPNQRTDFLLRLEAPPISDEELEGDEMLPAAVDVILETGQASVSILQRKLKLGYARAARILDEMEEKGIVGPFQGSRPRAILINKAQWEERRKSDFTAYSSVQNLYKPVLSRSEDPPCKVATDPPYRIESTATESSAPLSDAGITVDRSTSVDPPLVATHYQPKAASGKPTSEVGPLVRKIENVVFFCGCLLLFACFFVSSKSSFDRTGMFLFGVLACLLAKFRFARWLMFSIIAGGSALSAIPLMWNNGSFDLAGFLTVCFLGSIFIYYGRKTLRSSIFSKARTCYASLQDIDSMTGLQFEEYSAQLLRRLGYTNVRVTQASGDQGIDVLAEKDGLKYAIQCKNYHSKLGNTPVQEAFAGKVYYGCDVAVVLTNNTFTDGAFELAESTGVLLWDRQILARMITQAK